MNKEYCKVCGEDEDEVSIAHLCEDCDRYVCQTCYDFTENLCDECAEN